MLQQPQDRFLNCQHCGITFVWTGWEQLHDAQPAHCPGCRHLLRSTRRWGVVKWFDRRKGFGFITTADGAEVYVRRNNVKKGRLQRGRLVSFRLRQSKSGSKAVQVRVQPAADAAESD